MTGYQPIKNYTLTCNDVMEEGTQTNIQQPTESGNNPGPWLADNQSPDLNNEFWLVVYLVRSVPGTDTSCVTD